MSADRLLDEVRAALRRDIPARRFLLDGEDVVILAYEDAAAGYRAAWCREIAAELTDAGFHCSRSRTRVRVTREPREPKGPPDFICRRRP